MCIGCIVYLWILDVNFSPSFSFCKQFVDLTVVIEVVVSEEHNGGLQGFKFLVLLHYSTSDFT